MSLTISPCDSSVLFASKNNTTMRTTSARTTDVSNALSNQANKSQERKEPEGAKSEAWRQKFIKMKGAEYKITRGSEYSSSLGKNFEVYYITAKVDVNLSKLKKDLGIKPGIISSYNDNYEQYDYNGHYIDNKPMKDVTIKVPIHALGENIDDRNILEQIGDFLSNLL